MAKGPTKFEKRYEQIDGEIVKTLNDQCVIVHVKYLETEESVMLDVREQKESTNFQAALFGYQTSATSASGTKGEGFEPCQARFERFFNNEWTSEKGETGPRIGILVQAIVAAKAAQGVERDPVEMHATVAAMTNEQRAQVRKGPLVAVEYERIQLEAKKESLKKAQAAAKEAAKDETDDSGLADL